MADYSGSPTMNAYSKPWGTRPRPRFTSAPGIQTTSPLGPEKGFQSDLFALAEFERNVIRDPDHMWASGVHDRVPSPQTIIVID